MCALLVYVSRQNNTPDQSLGTERQQSNAVMPVRFDKLGHATEKPADPVNAWQMFKSKGRRRCSTNLLMIHVILGALHR